MKRDVVRVNQRIRAREVRTIDADGKQLGVLPLKEAFAIARRRGVDLVEVAPEADPPVCKIMDYGKFRYEQTKKAKEARKHQQATRVKELKFHANIDEHDYQTKLKHARDFLGKGVKVKCNLILRGRERAHADIGIALMNRFAGDLAGLGAAEMTPRMIGRSIHMMIGAVPPRQTERKRAVTAEPAEREAAETPMPASLPAAVAAPPETSPGPLTMAGDAAGVEEQPL